MRKWLWLIWLWPALGLGAGAVNDLTLNGGQADAILNINDQNATVNLRLSASEPVKWNTIAICAVADSVCSRTTAVKYFTQTSSFSETVSKSWDGKQSSGSTVPTGEYKIKATVKNAGGEEAIVEFSSPRLTIVSGAVISATNDDDEEGDETSTSNEANGDGKVSAHASQTVVSTAKAKANWQIDLGRERVVQVGAPIEFEVVTVTGSGDGAKYRWSFGDGSGVKGSRASHRYLQPGTYEVVVTGKTTTNKQAVGRTRVTVLSPQFNLAWSEESSGALVLTNEADAETNLDGFSLLSASGEKFVFPLDTIMPPADEIILDPRITGLSTAAGVELLDPLGEVVKDLPSPGEIKARAAKLAELTAALAAAERSLLALTARPAPASILSAETAPVSATTTTTSLITVSLGEKPSSTWERWLKFWRLLQ